MDRLSNIIRDFNDLFGNIDWKNKDKIESVIAEELPTRVAQDRAYQNAMANSDRQNARIEHDEALARAVTEFLADHTELFKQFSDNESFRHGCVLGFSRRRIKTPVAYHWVNSQFSGEIS